MIKVTKKQLREAVVCNTQHNYRLIEGYWPKARKRITLIEFILKAREKKVSDDDIQFMLYQLNERDWRKAVRDAHSVPGESVEDIDIHIVDSYLKLFRQ